MDFPLSLESWALAGLAVFLAYVIHGITGFGATVLVVPALAHLMPMTRAIPVQAVQDFVAGVLLGQSVRRDFDRIEFLWLAIPMFLGMAAGAALRVSLPPRVLLIALGLFAIGYGVVGLFGRVVPPAMPRWAAIPFGLVGGVASTLFGAGGPIYVMYIANRLRDPVTMRATFIMFALTSATLRVVVFAGAGLLTDQATWLTVAMLLPFLVAGVALGKRLQPRLSARVNRSLIYVLLIAGGVSLLVRWV